MQINVKEFEKCKTGKEFKANFISYPGPKPPVGMPKWFKEWSEKVFEPRMANVETRLDSVETHLDKIDGVLARNNLH